MTKIAKILRSVSAFTLALAACSGGEEAPEADNVTETQMNDVDVIDGTISDDMIDIDSQKEEVPEDGDEESSDGDESSEDDDEASESE